ncbi:MAG: 50S ribosomal protein L32 [Patescibacteria group bacterium]|jgi:large subunit ribosomal protein L32
MANPKKRKTHSASHKGRSHLALKKTTLKKCPKCGQMRQPHTVCRFCGSYKGKEVLKIKTKATKKK